MLAAVLCAGTQALAQSGPARPADEIPQNIDRERRNDPDSKSDWERQRENSDFKEDDVPPPAYPKPEGLIEFRISSPGSFRYFVDAAALSIGKDEVVRYTLLVRSSSGVENISYEGIRCSNGTVKVFARGDRGKWSPARSSWGETTLRWEYELRTRYLCPMKLRVRSVDEALDALRRGGHPSLVNTGT